MSTVTLAAISISPCQTSNGAGVHCIMFSVAGMTWVAMQTSRELYATPHGSIELRMHLRCSLLGMAKSKRAYNFIIPPSFRLAAAKTERRLERQRATVPLALRQ